MKFKRTCFQGRNRDTDEENGYVGWTGRLVLPYIHNGVLHFIVQQKLTAEIIQHCPAIILELKKNILRETKKDIEKVKEVMCEENETR